MSLRDKAPNLSDWEIEELKDGGMEEDIPIISREIGRRLQQRQQHWTTIPTEPPQLPPQEAPIPTRIMLIGEGGAGKSALGSLLIGDGRFRTSDTSVSEALLCEEGIGTYGEEGRKIVVVDTPGRAFMESTDYGTIDKQSASEIESGALNETIAKMDSGIDVFILVLNNSYKRSRDLGINRLKKKKILNRGSTSHFMVVATHSRAHYSSKGADRFLQDVTEDPDVKKLMSNINNRVVLVELGTGPLTADSAMSGMAVYDKEREQARNMVMSMVYKVMNDNREGGVRYTSAKNKPTCWERLLAAIRAVYLAIAACFIYCWTGLGNCFRRLCDKAKCFPSMASVYTTNGKKAMKELRLNDLVLVVNQKGQIQYEPIIMFSHASADDHSQFVSVTTESGKMLRLSPSHLLHVGERGTLHAAKELQVGSRVLTIDKEDTLSTVTDKVKTVSREWLTGLYCPHTPSGSIIVDGILTSCYTNLLPTMLAHSFLIPVILLHRILPTKQFTWILSCLITPGIFAKIMIVGRSFVHYASTGLSMLY